MDFLNTTSGKVILYSLLCITFGKLFGGIALIVSGIILFFVLMIEFLFKI